MKTKDKIFTGFVIPILIISGLFAYLALESINVKGNDEWSNNATLIAEVGVGIVVTLFVLLITKLNELKIEEKVSGVFDIVTEQEKIRKDKERSMQSRLLIVFENMKSDISQIISNSHEYDKAKDDLQKQKLRKQIILDCKHIRLLSEKNLDDHDIVSIDFFDLNTIGTLKTISNICKNKPIFDDNKKTVNISYCYNLQMIILPWIDELSKKLEIKSELISTQQEKESVKDTVSISVSSDRTVYPLDSVIHVRANLSNVIPDELITFEIYNSNRKLLLSQTIDPSIGDEHKLGDSTIFQVTFRMKGPEWKIGDEYTVKSTYDSSFAEDSFLIDQRMPVVQSDKSVYIIGSDMIVTVIDPDADKDNQVAEYVGDREDSKLIIESPYGKIEGYRLRETGDSTGIFQGIIGILGIRKDGSVIPQTADGKVIDKIQGTELDDGYIGGSPGDELTIRYKNKEGTAHLTFFISNFGVAIELDQKVYTPTDKVYITIVAPDLNLNSNMIDEIGINPESIIQIRTSKDKINKYKLVETDNDTGIFTGEIQLANKSDESNLKSNNDGPVDGKLLCDDDDFIEVSLNLFDNETVIGRAMIKSIENDNF